MPFIPPEAQEKPKPFVPPEARQLSNGFVPPEAEPPVEELSPFIRGMKGEGSLPEGAFSPFGDKTEEEIKNLDPFQRGILSGVQMIRAIPEQLKVVYNSGIVLESEKILEQLKGISDEGTIADFTVKEIRDAISNEKTKAEGEALENYITASSKLMKYEGGSDIPKTIYKINSVSDFGKFAASTIGQTFPQLVLAIGTLGTGTLFLETGSIQMQMIDELSQETGMSPEEIINKAYADPKWAVGGGIIAGSLDLISLGIIAKATGLTKISSKLITKGAKEVGIKATKKQIAIQISKGIAVSMASEGIQEPTQGIIESYSAAKGTDKDYEFDKEQFLTEMLAGGIMGAALGGAGTAIKQGIKLSKDDKLAQKESRVAKTEATFAENIAQLETPDVAPQSELAEEKTAELVEQSEQVIADINKETPSEAVQKSEVFTKGEQKENVNTVAAGEDVVKKGDGSVEEVTLTGDYFTDVEQFDTFEDARKFAILKAKTIDLNESSADFGESQPLEGELKEALEILGVATYVVNEEEMTEGNYAEYWAGKGIKFTDGEKIPASVLFHELGEYYYDKLQREGAKFKYSDNIFNSPTMYGARAGNEAFAENFRLFILAPETLNKLSPETYNEMSSLIPYTEWQGISQDIRFSIYNADANLDSRVLPFNKIQDRTQNITTAIEAIKPTEALSDAQLSKAKDKLAGGLEMLARVTGVTKNIVPVEGDSMENAIKQIGEGLIDLGIATVENVAQKIKEHLKEQGITYKDADIEAVYQIKKTPVKEKTGKSTKPKTSSDILIQKLEEDVTTEFSKQSAYIKRIIKDDRLTPEFRERANELGEYKRVSKEKANIASQELLNALEDEHKNKEKALDAAFNLLQEGAIPPIMFGSLSAKISARYNSIGREGKALDVIMFKSEKAREFGQALSSLTENASPEETVSRIFAGLASRKEEALEGLLPNDMTGSEAIAAIQEKYNELEKKYKELVENGDITTLEKEYNELFKPVKGARLTQRSRHLKQQGQNLKRKGYEVFKAGLKKQSQRLSMGFAPDEDTMKGLVMMLEGFIYETEGNILEAWNNFKQFLKKQEGIAEKDLEKIRKELLDGNKEVITTFKAEIQKKAIDNILKPVSGKETKTQREARRVAVEGFIADLSEGKSSEELSENMSEISKFDILSKEDKKEILDLVEKQSELTVEGKHMLAKDAWTDLMIKLGDVNLKNREWHETMLDLWYTGVLSGLTTVRRSLFGSGITSVFFTTMRLLASPKAAPLMFSAMLKGWRGADKNYAHVLKTGDTDVTISDFKPRMPSYTSTIFKKLIGGRKQSLKDTAVAGIMFLPTLMFRNIVAFDQVLTNSAMEGNLALFEFNKTDKGKTILKRVSEARRALLQDQELSIKSQVADEISAMKKNGEKVPLGYANRRQREIRNNRLDGDLVKRAIQDAKEGALVSTPKGTLGSVYNIWINAIEINKADKSGTKAFKLFMKSIFPFIRVAFNWMNAGLDYTPVGAVRGFKSYEWTKDGVRQKDGFQRRENMVKSATGLALFVGIILSMFDIDEDDEGEIIFSLKDEEDSWIKISGNLSGNWYEHKDVSANELPWSVRFKNPFTGEWSAPFQYRDSPMGLMLAPIGIMRDEIIFGDLKKEASGDKGNVEIKDLNFLLQASTFGTFQYAMGQSFNQGMTTISKIANPKSPETLNKSIGELITKPATGFVPGIYKQLYNQYKGYNEIPEKEREEWYKNPAKMLPIIDSVLEYDKYDVFGIPISRTFDVPFVPDWVLKEAKDNLDYREDYKEWQLLWKYEGVIIGNFRAPKTINGEKTSFEQKDKWMYNAGIRMRKYVSDNYERLNNLDDIELQIKLNGYKKEADKYADKQLEKGLK